MSPANCQACTAKSIQSLCPSTAHQSHTFVDFSHTVIKTSLAARKRHLPRRKNFIPGQKTSPPAKKLHPRPKNFTRGQKTSPSHLGKYWQGRLHFVGSGKLRMRFFGPGKLPPLAFATEDARLRHSKNLPSRRKELHTKTLETVMNAIIG